MNSIKKNTIINSFIALNLLLYLLYFFVIQNNYLLNAKLFYGTQDRFADFIKVIFSFNHIYSEKELLDLNVPTDFIYFNPYSQILEWETTIIMAVPPLMLMFFLLSSYLAKLIGFNYLVLFAIFSFCILLIIFYIFKKELIDNKKYILILFSFPTLFLFDRGNLPAAVSALLLFYLIKKFILSKNYSFFDIIIFVLMASIRPNYIIFGLIFIFNKKFKATLLEFFKIFLTYILFNLIFLIISVNLYHNYSIRKFAYSFREYAFVHDSPWNSSAYGFLNNTFNYIVSREFDFVNTINIDFLSKILNSRKFIYLILFFYLLIIIFVYLYVQNKNINRLNFILILLPASTLFTHPFAEYHLIIFVFTFILVLNTLEGRNLKINSLLIALVLLPKLYFYFPSYNVPNTVNFFTLNFLIIYNYLYMKKEVKC